MRALAAALAAVGLLDLLLGLARGSRAVVAAAVAAVVAAAAGGWAVGCSATGCAILAASVAVESPLWVAARRGGAPGRYSPGWHSCSPRAS